MKIPRFLLCGAHSLFFVALSLWHMKTSHFQNASNLRRSLSHHLFTEKETWKQTVWQLFPQLGSSNCTWGYKTWTLPFSSPLAGLFPPLELPWQGQQWQHQARSGSPMPCCGSQVKEMVMAKRVPHCTFSTRCRFSEPEVKNDTRPAKTKDFNPWMEFGTRLQLSLHSSAAGCLQLLPADLRAHRSPQTNCYQLTLHSDCLLLFKMYIHPLCHQAGDAIPPKVV